jgi:hypothetical protein
MSVKTELKLAYLKDTKNLIKNAIIEKGQDVSDSDTFRSYADKILAIAGGGETDAGVTINLDGLTEVLPITDITVPDDTDGMVPVMQPVGIEAGSIYLIVWNNVGYICEAQAVEFQGLPVIAVGNSVAWGGEDTGEPFAIGEFSAEVAAQTGGVYGGIIPLDGSTSFSAGGYFIGKNSSETILEDLPVALDFSNGNQTLTAPDGYLVKSAIIEKPASLVPENIMSGIDIAGIIGSAVAGGGSKKLKYVRTSLSTSGATRVTKEICAASENDPFFVLVYRPNPKAFSKTTNTDFTFAYAYAFDTRNGTFAKGSYSGNMYSRTIAYQEGSINFPYISDTQTGLLDPIDTSGLTGMSALFHQGDIYFYRNANGVGCIDVGIPLSSSDGKTYKWATNESHEVIAFIMED